MMITAMLVDDEPLARARISRLLKGQDVQIVGEAENALTALQLVEDLRPDIVFLDIQMPGLTGVQMASALLHLETAPLLVFVTGYSEHALEAFEFGALDYLVKPISLERLTVTLGRARERLSDKQWRIQAQLNAGKNVLQTPPLRSLPVRADFAVQFVALNDIIYLFSREKRVFALTGKGEFRTFYTLTQLETMLPGDRFLRIHDSYLVNLDAVVELLFLGDHTYEVRLSNRQLLRVGRTHYAELQRRMGLTNHPTV